MNVKGKFGMCSGLLTWRYRYLIITCVLICSRAGGAPLPNFIEISSFMERRPDSYLVDVARVDPIKESTVRVRIGALDSSIAQSLVLTESSVRQFVKVTLKELQNCKRRMDGPGGQDEIYTHRFSILNPDKSKIFDVYIARGGAMVRYQELQFYLTGPALDRLISTIDKVIGANISELNRVSY